MHFWSVSLHLQKNLIAYFTISITETAKHANVDYGQAWAEFRSSRRIYELKQWAACCRVFPLLPASHLGMNFLKMKLCIKYVAKAHLNINEGPRRCGSGRSGPSWTVAITDYFPESVLWYKWNERMSMNVTQTKAARTQLHTCGNAQQILCVWCVRCLLDVPQQETQKSPFSSLFMFSGKTPQLLLLMPEYSFSCSTCNEVHFRKVLTCRK